MYTASGSFGWARKHCTKLHRTSASHLSSKFDSPKTSLYSAFWLIGHKTQKQFCICSWILACHELVVGDLLPGWWSQCFPTRRRIRDYFNTIEEDTGVFSYLVSWSCHLKLKYDLTFFVWLYIKEDETVWCIISNANVLLAGTFN